MKKQILSLMTFLTFSLALHAQEMLDAGGKKYTVADIQSIEVITVRASLADVLAKYPEYSIFSEALEKTGLADTISAWNKDRLYEVKNNFFPIDYSRQVYYPKVNYIKFTVFAVDNETFRTMGVTDFNSLKAKCAEWYGEAAGWYDYPGKGSMGISTGEDYEYTYNVVNMFVRYHILKAGMKYDDLVLSASKQNEMFWNWNFAFGGEPYDYYETLLPNTLLKVWQPLYHNTGSATNIWINRYVANNTLTDQLGLYGSEAMHSLIDTGALVESTKSDIKAINGFIHNVSKPLVYSNQVAHGVLNERLRIDVSDMLYELSSNGMKCITQAEIPGGYDASRCIFSNDYFDYISVKGDSNAVIFHGNNGTWRAWNAEMMEIMTEENVEILLRLPPVPTGEYELRLPYPVSYNGKDSVQVYIGTERNMESMTKLGDGYNTTTEPESAEIGYVRAEQLTDYGVASDSVMRSNGYMRMPASFSRGQSNTIKEPATSPEDLVNLPYGSVRYDNVVTLRKILGTVQLEQDKEYWLGFKLGKGLIFWLDFIELVPTSIVNNTTYTEDWY